MGEKRGIAEEYIEVLPVTLARLYLSSRFVESNGSQSADGTKATND